MKVVYLAKRSKTESAKSKVETATGLAGLGGAIGSAFGPMGSAIGAGVGGVTGLIIGDNKTVFPIDMVAIPAFQAHLIQGMPSFQIYIKAGETLVPTGGNVQDMKENMLPEAKSKTTGRMIAKAEANKREASAYNKRFSKFFKQVKSDYMKKDGSWKKNGFKRAVKEAHKLAGMGGKK